MKYQLIDELCIQDWSRVKDGYIPDVAELAGAQVFRIDNVDHFLWQHIDNYRQLADFPNVAPPFNNYFMYCQETKISVAGAFRYGIWFQAADVRECDAPDEILWMTSMGTNRMQLYKAGVHWLVRAWFFLSYGKKHGAVSPVSAMYLVMEDGSLYSDMRWGVPRNDTLAAHYHVDENGYMDRLIEEARRWLAPCLLATSLLHCKNVQAIDGEPTSRDRYAAQEYERKARKPIAKWKVLSIEPMVRTLRTQGALGRNDLQKALHICRGHFKDFSKGKGLFGKNKGLYWWDQQMRGSESAGVVIKDYNILPPEDSTTQRPP